MSANPDDHQVKPFTQFLLEQRRGLLHAELTDALNSVVAGVVQHGKAGKLTINLTIKTSGDGVVAIADTYAAKIPTPPAEPGIWFADESGAISRNRLNQEELPLRGIDGGTSTDKAASA
jgi:hypothetical protein